MSSFQREKSLLAKSLLSHSCHGFDKRWRSKSSTHLAKFGLSERRLPFSSTQSMIGGGSPLARQSRTRPVRFEYRTREGGSPAKAGPYAALPVRSNRVVPMINRPEMKMAP